MANKELQNCIKASGVENALSVVDIDEFYEVIEKNKAEEAVHAGCFYRFLQSIIMFGIFPASWQKLANLQWSDEEISCLIDSELIKDSPTTLVAAINAGALDISEYNEFANYPNQEIDIFYLTKSAQSIKAWLNEYITLPKIADDAFVG